MLVAGYCTLCRSRCGSLNEVHEGRLTKVIPLPDHPTGGALCAKGRAAPELLASPLRITQPMRRTAPRDAADPQWETISWDDALDEIAARLMAQKARAGAESVAFAVTTPSGTPMVDSFEWVERFIRLYGSPNMLYAIEICGWHKDYAHALTFGRGIGVPDMDHAEVVLLWGHNPARTWLAMASGVSAARQRGAKVVVIDPKQDGSGQQADLWMPIRPGADGALAMGAIRHLLKTESFDVDFVRRWSNAALLVDVESGKLLRAHELWADGSSHAYVVQGESGALQPQRRDEPGSHVNVRLYAQGTCQDVDGNTRQYASVLTLLREQAEVYTPEHVAATTWIDIERVESFNALFMHAPKLVYHSWTGVGQHSNATQTERAIATLYALTGACDKEGGNLWTSAPPFRLVNQYTTLLSKEQRDKALGLDELPLGPPRLGWITTRDLSKAVLEGVPYKVNTLISFGTNLLVTQADTERNQRTLHALDFHVHVDVFMNPSAQSADIVLPANLPWEREALKCGFEISQEAVEHIQLRPRMVTPPGQARADYEIVMALAQRMGMADDFFEGDIEAGWNYQLEPLGITVEDLRRHPEGMRFPQPTARQKYARTDAQGMAVGFATPCKRVELYSEALLDIGQSPLPTFVEPAERPELSPEFPIVLTTAKSGWFVHSSHRHVASLRRKAPDPQVQIGPEYAQQIGVTDGDWVKIITPQGEVRMKAKVTAALNDKVAIADFGWWQGNVSLGRPGMPISGASSSNINSILSDAGRDPISGSVPLRAITCRIEADHMANLGNWSGNRAFRIKANRCVTDDIRQFDFIPEDNQALPSFLPGQHVIVSAPGMSVSRAYSLVGANNEPSELSIAVRLATTPNQPDGRMSTHLHQLPAGSTVHLTRPSGVFTLPTETDRPLILVAGGIGITPFIGHLQALKQRRDAGLPTPTVLLVFSCRPDAPHPFQQTIEALADAIGTVTAHYVAGPDVPAFDLLCSDHLTKKPLAYLCGSPGFLKVMRQALCDQGIPNFDIFEETFSAEREVPDTLIPQPVSIADSDQSFTWAPAAGTLLDAADSAGVAMPSGCRVGQCESCVMTVVQGQVAHLTSWDGPTDQCLTCMSVPLTPVVLRR